MGFCADTEAMLKIGILSVRGTPENYHESWARETDDPADDLIDRLTAVIEENKAGLSSSTSQSAILLLLDIPIELILRERRETLFKALVGKSRRDKKHELPVGCWKTVLSLMVKLMGRPTFYEVRGRRCRGPNPTLLMRL